MKIYRKCLVIVIIGTLSLMGFSSATSSLLREKTSNDKILDENNLLNDEMMILNNPPIMDYIKGPTRLKAGELGKWLFHAWDNDSGQLQFIINWGDGTYWITPWVSCVGGAYSDAPHIYYIEGTYNITVYAQDRQAGTSGNVSLQVIVPRARAVYHPLLLRFLERFPLLERLLSLIKVI